MTRDWTAKGGVSNTSEEYEQVVTVVERLIRNGAHAIVGGHVRMVARGIVSQLAHNHGFAPAPRRDDAVAVWLKSKRDEYEPGDPGYFTLDRILNDYRLHADTGAPLSAPTDELGPHAHGEV